MAGFQTEESQGFGGVGGGREAREPNWDEKIPWWQWPDDNNLYQYRLVGNPFYYGTHWIPMKKKDGSKGKSFGVQCRNFNPAVRRFEDNGCPVCDLYSKFNTVLGEQKVPWKQFPEEVKSLKTKFTLATNLIVRDIQSQGQQGPDWRFIVPARLPQGFAQKLDDLAQKMNKNAESKKGFFDFNHIQYGKDLFISYNSNAQSAGDYYSVQVGQVTPVTEAEMAFQAHLVDFSSFYKVPDAAKTEDLLRRNGLYELLSMYQSNQALGIGGPELGKSNAAVPAGAEAAAPMQAPRVTPQARPAGPATVASVPLAPPVQAVPMPSVPVPPAPVPQAAPSAFATSESMSTPMSHVPTPAKANTMASAPFTPPVAPVPAQPAPVAAPAAPAVNPMAQMAQAMQQPAAPVVQPAMAPPAAVQVAPATAGAAMNLTGATTGDKLVAFLGEKSLQSRPVTEEFSPEIWDNFRYVKRGSQVPQCFTLFTQQMPTGICKGCPVKLDCMQADTSS